MGPASSPGPPGARAPGLSAGPHPPSLGPGLGAGPTRRSGGPAARRRPGPDRRPTSDGPVAGRGHLPVKALPFFFSRTVPASSQRARSDQCRRPTEKTAIRVPPANPGRRPGALGLWHPRPEFSALARHKADRAAPVRHKARMFGPRVPHGQKSSVRVCHKASNRRSACPTRPNISGRVRHEGTTQPGDTAGMPRAPDRTGPGRFMSTISGFRNLPQAGSLAPPHPAACGWRGL